MKDNQYVDTIKEAIKLANDLDYENGMATSPVTVEFTGYYLKVIRKCGSLTHPEILLFKVVPKNGMLIDYAEIGENILNGMDIYGDLKVEFEGDVIKTAVIENITN